MAPAVDTADVLAVTPVGHVRAGDRFFFRRITFIGRMQTGWVRASSVHAAPSGDLIVGTDDRGRSRSIRPTEVTRIRRPRNNG